MALKFTVDSLDDVNEDFRDLYTEKDGKFVLGVDGLPEPEDTSGLKTALEKEREANKKYSKQIKAWERTGKSPEEIAELLEAREEAERKKAEEEGDFEKLLSQHKKGWEREKAEMEAELEAARTSERESIITNNLLAALTRAGANEEGVDLLPERLSRRIKFERDGTQRIVRILSADGETPLAGTAKDGTATFDDLVKEAVSKYPRLFNGSGNGGSGKLPEGKAGGTGTKRRSDLKTSKDRAAFIEEHGLDAYKALPM